MKITKSELKGLIKEELLEVFGLEIPIGLPKTEGSGSLDYYLKEHFFSPLNPTNK